MTKASITPSCELLMVEGLSGSTSATIKINGVPFPLKPCLSREPWDGLMFNLCPNKNIVVVLDDQEGSPSFKTVGNCQEVKSPYEGTCNHNHHESSDPSAKFIWIASGLTPGLDYRVSVSLWEMPGSDRSTDVVIDVLDGSNNKLYNSTHFDLTKQIYPRSDRTERGLDLLDIGTVSLPATQNTIQIVMSNGSGSGVIAGDCALVRSLPKPIVSPGDAVTITLDDGRLVDHPVRFLTDDEYMVFDPYADRKMQVGYNQTAMRSNLVSLVFANHAKGMDPWNGDATVDKDGLMVGNTGTSTPGLFYRWDAGWTPRGLVNVVPGMQTFFFTVSKTFRDGQYVDGLFDDAAQQATGMVGDGVYGEKKFTQINGNRWMLQQPYDAPPWTEIKKRDRPFSPGWTHPTRFTTGSVLQDFVWYDSLTPPDWNKVAHPVDYNRHANANLGSLRWLDIFGITGSMASTKEYFPPQNAVAAIDTRFPVVRQFHVTSIRPIDTSSEDKDGLSRYATEKNPYAGWMVATGDGTNDGFVTGQTVTWWGPTDFGGPPGFKMLPSSFAYIPSVVPHPNNKNELLVNCSIAGDKGQLYDGDVMATIDKVYQVDAKINSHMTATASIEEIVQECVDVGVPPWINIPAPATDQLVDDIGHVLVERCPPGRPIYIEYGNEWWNFGFQQYALMKVRCAEAQYLHKTDPANHPVDIPGPFEWMTWESVRMGERLRDIFRAANRDPNDIQVVVGTQTQNLGITQAIAEFCKKNSLKIDWLTGESYQDITASGMGFKQDEAYIHDFFDRLSIDGYIDMLTWATVYGTRVAWTQAQRSLLNSNGLNNVKLCAYEGGPSYLSQYGTIEDRIEHSTRIMLSPRMHRYTLAEMWNCEKAGLLLYNRYTSSYTYAMVTDTCWTDHHSGVSLAGNGNPLENKGLTHGPDMVSQLLGGRRIYSRGRDFPVNAPNSAPCGRPSQSFGRRSKMRKPLVAASA